MNGGAITAQQPDHHPFEFSPILIGLVGIVAGAIMLALYQCIAIASLNNRSNQMLNPTTFRREQDLARIRARPIRPNNENSNRGVARVLHLLPVFEYTKGREGEEGTCAVCLGEFIEGEELRTLPKCRHSFHAPCIDMWLFSHANCPLCRADMSAPLPPGLLHLVVEVSRSEEATPQVVEVSPEFRV